MPIAQAFPKGSAVCPPCPPGSASWKELEHVDLTGLDSQSMVDTVLVTTTLAKGGVPYIDVSTSTNATSYDYSAGASGVTYNTMAGVGVSSAAFDLTTKLSKTGAGSLTFDDWQEPVCVMFQLSTVTWGSTVHDLIVGFGEVVDKTPVSTVSFAWRVNYDGVDNNWQARRYVGTASDTNCIINEPTTATITCAIIVHAGLITEMWTSPGGTSIPADPRTLTDGPFSAGYTGIAGGTMPLALNAGFCPFLGVARGGAGTDPVFTLSNIKVFRWE